MTLKSSNTFSKIKIAQKILIAVLLIIGNIRSVGAQTDGQTPPNIIVFLVDDMGIMDSSVPFLTDSEGALIKYPLNDYYQTPHMEKLVAQGIRFTNFYAHSVCSPSRTSILTGQNSARHGVTNWVHPESNNKTPLGPSGWNWKGLDKSSVTLPRLLQAQGYTTIHVGKAHFGPLNSDGEDPTNIGFDVNIGGSAIGQPGSYLGTEAYGVTGGDKHRAVPGLENYHGKDVFLTEALTLEANKAITEAKEAGKPFYLNMWHYAVHAPFYSDSRFKEHYSRSGKSENAQAYATLVEGIDKSLGDIVQHVKNLGLGNNTLILFVGDNGSDAPLPIIDNYSSASPLKGKKGNHWEGGMRVPFIASWVSPDPHHLAQQSLPINQNTVQTQLGSILDIFPTLIRLSGAKTPENYPVDGFQLHLQLTGNQNLERDEMFLNHFPHEHRSSYFTSLVNSDWKIIYHYQSDGTPKYELFNLNSDPFETTNVADSHPEQLKKMMALLYKELEDKNALYPEKDQQPLRPILPK